jgi:transcriptional regulator with XRE-family HTH domain
MTDPRSFGAWLRRERERRSVTLRAIADRTKIGVGLLEALERGDVSRWPGGIYRRAFVRAYAGAVGLDADLVVANFERVFSSDTPAPGAGAAAAVSRVEQQEMRLALVTPAVGGIAASAMRTAGRDLACVFGCALAAYAVAGAVGFWSAAALIAIAFHVSRVLGLQYGAMWNRLMERRHAAAAEPRAQVVSFADQHARATSSRARARRVLADLSAAAISVAASGRRRAARL